MGLGQLCAYSFERSKGVGLKLTHGNYCPLARGLCGIATLALDIMISYLFFFTTGFCRLIFTPETGTPDG